MAARLEIANLQHRYGDVTVIKGLSFDLQPGQIGCLLGQSGCGKTTLLRCIAGFEELTQGSIRFNDREVSRPGYLLPPEQRQIGMVFQDYALFPHLSVAENIAFGIRESVNKQARVANMLELVGLLDSAKAYPHQLSGGQQQRVALARALAPQPDLLLLDEPFSNLDIDLRERLSIEVRGIIKQSGTTAVLVTHDQHEAFAMADEIGVMRNGSIEQWDTAYNLYHKPSSRFIADFVGLGVFIRGMVTATNTISTELGELTSSLSFDVGKVVELLLRPDDIVHDDASPWLAEVVAKAFRGAEFLYTLNLASGTKILSFVPSHHNHAIGEKIGIKLEIDHVVAFPI